MTPAPRLPKNFAGSQAKPSGFTLIELLVVVSLIAILAAGIGLAIVGAGRGDVGVGERTLQGILISARTQAIIQQGNSTFPIDPAPGNGASTLLLINNDPNDRENYLRQITVVHWGEDVDGDVGWLSATGTDTLPPGVYIDPALSRDLASGYSLTAMTINLDTPSAIAQDTGGSRPFFYIPFHGSGRLHGGLDEFILALGAGTLPFGATEVEWDGERAKGGFLILRSGVVYRIPDESVISEE